MELVIRLRFVKSSEVLGGGGGRLGWGIELSNPTPRYATAV
jgi:hypothetical protein